MRGVESCDGHIAVQRAHGAHGVRRVAEGRKRGDLGGVLAQRPEALPRDMHARMRICKCVLRIMQL